MRNAVFATALIALPMLTASPVTAAAQSTGLEQACVAVAKNFLLTPVLTTGVVQSFPELQPPGARLTYSTRAKPEPTDFTSEIDCEFEKAQAPFGLTRFCISSTCYSPSEQDEERQRRFREVKALMDRPQK